MVHRRLTDRPRDVDEQGGIVLFTALLIVPLLVIAAIVVDIGIARMTRRQTQSAADAAALAAAGVLGSGESAAAADAVARSYVTSNGFDGAEAWVNIPPGSGEHAGDHTCAEVIVPTTSPAFFAGVIDIDSLDVDGRAVACAPYGPDGPYAIFAGSSSCQTTIQWSGSSNHVYGAVHSNGSIKIAGSENEIAGYVTYGTTANGFDSNTTLVPAEANPAQLPVALAYPVDFHVLDYAPGGARALEALAAGRYYNAGISNMNISWLTLQGLWNSTTKQLRPGLYFTLGDVDLNANQIQGDGVTLVAMGKVTLSGSNHMLRPWDPGGLMIFSAYQKASPLTQTSNCTSGSIKLSGSTNDWEGVIYAPFGEIQMSAASNVTLQGSIIGLSVTLSGSSLNIDSTQDADSQPRPIELVE